MRHWVRYEEHCTPKAPPTHSPSQLHPKPTSGNLAIQSSFCTHSSRNRQDHTFPPPHRAMKMMVSQAHKLQMASNRFLPGQPDCKKDWIAAEATKNQNQQQEGHWEPSRGQIIHSHVTKDEDISYDPIPGSAVQSCRGDETGSSQHVQPSAQLHSHHHCQSQQNCLLHTAAPHYKT